MQTNLNSTDNSSTEKLSNPLWEAAFRHYQNQEFQEAYQLYKKDFESTGDHKSLHNMAWMRREMGFYEEALEIIETERQLLQILSPDSQDTKLSICVNLYELSYLNLLLEKPEVAKNYFQEYENLDFESGDVCERACFYRLKGDLLKQEEPSNAQQAYQMASKCFEDLGDLEGIREIRDRLAELNA